MLIAQAPKDVCQQDWGSFDGRDSKVLINNNTSKVRLNLIKLWPSSIYKWFYVGWPYVPGFTREMERIIRMHLTRCFASTSKLCYIWLSLTQFIILRFLCESSNALYFGLNLSLPNGTFDCEMTKLTELWSDFQFQSEFGISCFQRVPFHDCTLYIAWASSTC